MSIEFVRVPEICKLRECGRTRLYEEMANGMWPKPIRLGPRTTVWLRSEVDSMLAAYVAGYSTDRIKQLVKDIEAKRKEFSGEAA